MLMQKNVLKIKQEYPAGTVIELTEAMKDPYSPLPAGSVGSVDMVDDAGTLNMHWYNGRTLGVIPNEDHFKVLLKPGDDTPSFEYLGLKFYRYRNLDKREIRNMDEKIRYFDVMPAAFNYEEFYAAAKAANCDCDLFLCENQVVVPQDSNVLKIYDVCYTKDFSEICQNEFAARFEKDVIIPLKNGAAEELDLITIENIATAICQNLHYKHPTVYCSCMFINVNPNDGYFVIIFHAVNYATRKVAEFWKEYPEGCFNG